VSRWSIPERATLLIVSDVDGTLLDEQHQLPLPPRELRRFMDARLGTRAAGSIFTLASSRSLLELVLLQRLLALSGPLIAEDGGVLAVDGDVPLVASDGSAGEFRQVLSRPYTVVRLGNAATEIRHSLGELQSDIPSPVLAEMGADELATRGFRSAAAVRRAITSREASVLLDLNALDEEGRSGYIEEANRNGLTIKRGGRWCTAVGGADKGRALRLLRSTLREGAAGPLYVVAIGNEENDVALLEQADLPLVIRNPGRGHHPSLLGVPGAFPLECVGTAGFLEMFDIISRQAEVVVS
jgi:mannosyl-3-phosphoglycerate phosphatase